MSGFECGLILGSLSTLVLGSGLVALMAWGRRRDDPFG